MFVVNENFDNNANVAQLPLTDVGGGGAGNGLSPSIGVTPVDGSGDVPTDGLEPVDPIPQDVLPLPKETAPTGDAEKRKRWFWIFLGLIVLAIIIFFVIKKTGTNGLPK